MNMESISVIDSNFDVNVTTSYFLSIQLSLDGFSFCVLDPVSNEYIQFWHKKINPTQEPTNVLEQELRENPVLLYPYQKIFFSYNSNYYTLVPDGIFNKEQAREQLNFTISSNNHPEGEVFFSKIKMADAWCIYSIPQELVSLLKKYYSDIHYFCEIVPFIENALLSTTIDSKKNHVHINVNNKYFDIAVTAGNNLILHNAFTYKNNNDFLYFTLFVFDQLKLNTSKTTVYLSGSIDKNDNTYAMLKKYIKRVELSTSTKHFRFSQIFKNIPIQTHLNLFNIPICV